MPKTDSEIYYIESLKLLM